MCHWGRFEEKVEKFGLTQSDTVGLSRSGAQTCEMADEAGLTLKPTFLETVDDFSEPVFRGVGGIGMFDSCEAETVSIPREALDVDQVRSATAALTLRGVGRTPHERARLAELIAARVPCELAATAVIAATSGETRACPPGSARSHG